MPLECERLQGFPDGWTDLTGCDVDAVTERVAASLLLDESGTEALRRKVRRWSKSCPDGARYKAIGNSMATPVMRWIGERILMVDSLDDGRTYFEGNDFARRLDGLIKADGRPLVEIGEVMEPLSPTTAVRNIRKWCGGHAYPCFESLMSLRRALGCTWVELLGSDGEQS